MSFITIIRDYVEFLNNLSESFAGTIPIPELLKETSIYILKTFQYIFIYIITFQWIRDFTLLPINIPQINTSILQEKLFLENSSNTFFSFLEVPNITQNTFILGFLNSIFLTFPVSVVHVLTIRRLYIKGIPSATFSIAGYIVGQLLFITCVIFGIRSIINPWLSLEPLNYIVGFILIFRVIYKMTRENLRELNEWDNPEYANFFLTNLILAWCEQSSLFQYFGNLSFGPHSSVLETSLSTTTFNTFFHHSLYIFGLGIGAIVFTSLWGFLILQLRTLWTRFVRISTFMQTVNKGSFVLAIGLSLSSIPFYGLEYLTTGPLGFVSQDQIFKDTWFDQFNLKDSVKQLGFSSQFTSVDVEIAPFDRGRYLLYPERGPMPFTIEELNYRGETEWVSRFDKLASMSDPRAGFLRSKLVKKQSTSRTPQSDEQDNTILPIQSDFSIDVPPFIYPKGSEAKEARFEQWYNLDPDIFEDETLPLELVFAETQDTSFPTDFARKYSLELENLDFKLKSKFYSNPIYKSLLALDIDFFLNRQPAKFRLTPEHESDLYTKRQILESYYDSLREYAKLPYIEEFEEFFDGTKSFSNKVYNQQFKGTLRTVCRLFSLTTDPESTENINQLVLKYDQPLYNLSENDTFSAYHEELSKNDLTNTNSFSVPNDIVSTPLYAGWDENLRKFVITNKFLPRSFAGYEFNLNNDIKNKFLKLKKVVPKTGQKDLFENLTEDINQDGHKIKFTVWPLPERITNQGKSKSTIPFITLYTPQPEFSEPNEEGFENLEMLPSNWETRSRRMNAETYENVFDYVQ